MSEGKYIKPQSSRFVALEGVRGLAAIVVVIHHYLLAFYPALIFGPSVIQHSRFEDNIFSTPLTLAFAGTFAVAIFFVLSGFVLTVGFFQTKRPEIIKKLAAKRYLRLMIPALATTLLVLLLIKLGALGLLQNVTAITNSPWLAGDLDFNANILNAIYSGTVGIFTEGSSQYNNVLWTMLTEFVGSFLVFGFVLLFGTYHHRWMAYVVAILLTFNSWFLPFILGMGIADLYVSGYLEKLKKNRYKTYFLVPTALILGAYPISGAEFSYYGFMNTLLSGTGIDGRMCLLTLGATLLILAVVTSKKLSEWLGQPRVSVLGKYTFALYLIHIPILYSVVFLAFMGFYPLLGYNLAALAAFVVAIPTLWLATLAFEKYVDAPAVKFSGSVGRIFENNESFELKKRSAKVLRKLSKLQIIFLHPPTYNEKPFVD